MTENVLRLQVCGGAILSQKSPEAKQLRRAAPYSSKIIKAGALISDTKMLLSNWDVEATVGENIKRVHRENVFGKSSRSRVEDILAIFRSRYLIERSVTKALVTLVRKKFSPAALDRLFYFHSARADRLLHDAVTEVLFPLREKGLMHVDVRDFQKPLAQWVQDRKTIGDWSEPTIVRIAQGLLSTLRDFGVLQGAVNKKIVTAFFPIESFAYIAFYLKQHQLSGAKVIELPDWK
jgi:hypothetical protein